jgi:Acyl-[acyl carrier protein]--UDP-N-acetylglucosamine O-acyltransferase
LLIEQDRRISSLVHPASIINENVNIGKNVKVGPFSIIEEGVSIGNNTTIWQ